MKREATARRATASTIDRKASIRAAQSRVPEASPGRVALVLGAGGSRGAYEAGVLAYLFQEIYPELPPGFEFDIVSGTSVGAVHAAYVAATAHETGLRRAQRLLDRWTTLRFADVFDLSPRELVAIPLRALGMSRLWGGSAAGIGGPGGRADRLGRIVRNAIPWRHLAANLATGRPGALCVPCTHVGSGRAVVFMSGALADPTAWSDDRHVAAEIAEIGAAHVRASGAIPFLVPPVRIGDAFYVDGALRLATPLSPAVRLGADRVLVISPRHGANAAATADHTDASVAQPAFLLGKLVNALSLGQLEHELAQISLVNAWIERGRRVFGEDFVSRMNPARSTGQRQMNVLTLGPSQDLAELAWHCQRKQGLGSLASLFTHVAVRGVPPGEADLLSYLYFDGCFTRELIELGRADAMAAHDQILALLGDACAVAA